MELFRIEIKKLIIVGLLFISTNLFSQIGSTIMFENPDSCIENYVLKKINFDVSRYEMWSKLSKKHTSFDDFKMINNDSTIKYKGYKIEPNLNIEAHDKYKNYLVYYYTIDNDTIKSLWTLELDSNFWYLTSVQSSFKRGRESFLKENYLDAIKYFKQAIEIDPYDAISYNYLAKTYFELTNKDSTFSKSLIAENAKLAIKYDPDNSDNYSTMGMYFSSLQSYNLSIHYYLKALDFTKDSSNLSTIYSNLSSMSFENEDTVNFKKYAELSIKLDSTQEFSYFILGKFNFKYEKFQIAKSYFEKLVNSQKLNPYILLDIYLKYAMCCYKTNDCNLAKEYYLKAVDLKPDNGWNDKFAKDILDCNQIQEGNNPKERINNLFSTYNEWRQNEIDFGEFSEKCLPWDSIEFQYSRYALPKITDFEKPYYDVNEIDTSSSYFNNDNFPDYLFSILPRDCQNGNGVFSIHPPIYLLMLSDGDKFIMDNSILESVESTLNDFCNNINGFFAKRLYFGEIFQDEGENMLGGDFNVWLEDDANCCPSIIAKFKTYLPSNTSDGIIEIEGTVTNNETGDKEKFRKRLVYGIR
ncbi:MAG: tetratricopeptide repeat protein [Bacteroidetes bacterium]|nr:tetratricopeptide repeat protein [Bacteroidota bacterium]